MINLTIPGEPCAKGRPKFWNGHTTTPKKTVNYEVLVKELFMISKQDKLEGQLVADIDAYFSIPQSKSKKIKLDMEHNTIRPTKRPDLDNIQKIILDALNGLAYNDDSQVVSIRANKLYSNNPRVEVYIRRCE